MTDAIRSYRDLEVYRRSYELALRVHKLSLAFPSFERFELGRQLREATKSIPANIAEGYGRKTSPADFKRFLVMSLGSCDEVRVWLEFCKDLVYVSEAECKELVDQYDQVGKMLTGLLKAWH